ncbi:hypothetical protein AB1285_26875 [Microbacterium sp. NRRL B-14842]|uniref:hypothetical protein n=1 Tax=Microbacterium sp. NRRL B-14842 TaxID=3162881 RepID=UPI003D2B76ED
MAIATRPRGTLASRGVEDPLTQLRGRVEAVSPQSPCNGIHPNLFTDLRYPARARAQLPPEPRQLRIRRRANGDLARLASSAA